MEKDKSSLYTFCSLPQEQISLTQMNPLYLYQCSPLGWMGGSMHVLGLAELLRLLPLLCCCCLFCVWLEREEIVGRGIRHVAPTCQPRSLFFLSPSAGLILSNPARTCLEHPWLRNPPTLTTTLLSPRLSQVGRFIFSGLVAYHGNIP